MNKLFQFSSKTKLMLGLSVIMAAVVIVITVSYFNLKQARKVQLEAEKSLMTTRDLTKYKSDQNAIHALLLELLFEKSADEKASDIQEVVDKIKAASQFVQSIEKSLIGHDDALNEFLEIEKLILVLDSNRKLHLDMIKNNKMDEAYHYAHNVQKPLFSSIAVKIEELQAHFDIETNALIEYSRRQTQASIVSMLIIGLALIIVTLTIIIFIRRLLSKISREIKEGVAVLSTSSAEIQTTIAEISTGAAETATAISETSTTIEEIRQTSMIANQKATSLMHSSQLSSDLAEKGLESSQQMIDAMNNIDSQMKVISNTIVKLSEQNRSIGEITSTVADIADQSNLLAVNAAIEAAKAGEQGRGFTVVAQEIRSLAEQSKKSTAQVKEILNEIQKSVNQAVEVINQGAKTVETGNKLVLEDRMVVETLTENVEEALQASIQITSSNQQQMAGMDQIVPAMENIKQASEQNVAGIRQAQTAMHDLTALSNKLIDLIEKYRL